MATIKNFPNNVDEYQYAQDAMKWMYSRTQGVYGADGNLSVTSLTTPAMSVNVSDGLGWLRDHLGNGCVFWNDNFYMHSALLNLTVDAADGVQNRIDRVVVSWTTSNYTQKPEIKILKGTLSASNPQPPEITNDTVKRELSLAKIVVAAGTTAITSAMITDERLDSTVCGLVTETVAVDTSVVQSQMTALLNQLQYDLEQTEAGAVLAHHATHATGGADALSPSDIGAASLTSGKVTVSEASSALATYNSGNHTLVLSDNGKMLLEAYSGATVITIPLNVFPVGAEIEVCRYWNAGAVSFAPASGVTLYSLDNLRSISGVYGVAALKQLETNVWLLAGALA